MQVTWEGVKLPFSNLTRFLFSTVTVTLGNIITHMIASCLFYNNSPCSMNHGLGFGVFHMSTVVTAETCPT